MNRNSLPEKTYKPESNYIVKAPRMSQSSHSNASLSNDANDKFKFIKLESLSSQQLKRRRSRSHCVTEQHSNGDFNTMSFSIYSNGTSRDSSQLSTNSTHSNKRCIIEKHKKETHNRVERKRRDFINGQIKKLADLLPSELLLNYDLKMNKGVILKNSVEYISSMKDIENINQHLMHEADLGSKLIKNLIAFKDLNCSELSLDESVNDTSCKDDVDINSLISEWHSVHLDNKELVQQFTQRLSQKLSEGKRDIVCENTASIDYLNNNSTHMLPPPRKRYSSVPAFVGTDTNGYRGNSSVNFVERNPVILNSLLKNSDISHQEINLEHAYDSLNYYLECSSASIADEDITDTTSVHSPIRLNNDQFFRMNDKIFYVSSKSSKSNYINSEIGHDDSLLMMDHQTINVPYDHLTNHGCDPMLLSDNFDNVDS